MKQCHQCNIIKSNDDFYFRKDSNTYRSTCKECWKEKRKAYRNTHEDKVQESKKTYYYKNQDTCCKRSMDWYLRNKDIKNEKHAVYIKKKRQEDVNFKIYSNMQTRIYSALRDNKSERTMDLIGCDICFFKTWLENQFDEKMSWDNHGTYWHIDHVKPCSSYDMTNPNEVKECFNWKNVRPLNKTLNLRKNDKIDIELIRVHKELAQSFATNLDLKNSSGSEQQTEV